jgi:divalent metal cation (Fe/Co/Zn/Cd) transporter
MLLSVALLVGLGLNYLLGWWQADPIAGLVIALFLAREGYLAVMERELCRGSEP